MKKTYRLSQLKHQSILLFTMIKYLLIHSFFSIIENTLGLLTAFLDIRGRKEIGDKILVCRTKNYSEDSSIISLEKYHLDDTLIDNSLEFELFYWDDDKSLFTNQVRLWFIIKRLNPWIIFFSSYSTLRKRKFSMPSVKYLEILRKKISSNIIFLWWDSCSDTFYESEIKKLEKVNSIHLIMDNPQLDFGSKNENINKDSMIASYTNYAKNTLLKPLKKEIDVVFLGQLSSYRDHRSEYIDFIKKRDFSIYLSTNDRGQQVEHSKYAEIMGKSRICINFSLSVDKHQLKGRIFEAMHSETMLLETNNSQTSTLFNDGIDYVSFSNKEDMLKKIKYYLINEKERKAIAQSGREKVLKFYNSKLFIKKILEHKGFINGKSSVISSN
jgi:spore maturation protein CgeB